MGWMKLPSGVTAISVGASTGSVSITVCVPVSMTPTLLPDALVTQARVPPELKAPEKLGAEGSRGGGAQEGTVRASTGAACCTPRDDSLALTALGLVVRSQQVGDVRVPRPLIVIEEWLESTYYRDHLPLEEAPTMEA